MRNRAQHDRTARRWTDLYARPPSPPPQVTVTPTPVTGSSNKRTKGKEKASTAQTASSSRSREIAFDSNGSTNTSEPIIIDDLVDEVSFPAPAAQRQSGRKRRREPGVIDVDLGEEERTRSRRRGSPERLSSRLGSSGEVIVIDD